MARARKVRDGEGVLGGLDQDLRGAWARLNECAAAGFHCDSTRRSEPARPAWRVGRGT